MSHWADYIRSVVEVGQTLILVAILVWIHDHRKKHAIPVRLTVRLDGPSGQSVTGVAESRLEEEKFDA